MSLELIDIGVNLCHSSFRFDRKEVIDRSIAAGVSKLIITGSDLKSCQDAQEFVNHYPDTLYFTAGVHPHYTRECNSDTIQILRQFAKKAVAIGECGLDYFRDLSPRSVQDQWFEEQIKLACELKRPLFLHERKAFSRFIEILKTYRDHFDLGVVHCFTGNAKELKAYLDLDLYIGITGWICDERRGVHLRDLVKNIPVDKLMLETDAPFLTPRDLIQKPKDNRNEPALLPHILKVVADYLGKSAQEVAVATTDNAHRFFGIYPKIN